jgi:tryptophan synthase alpha chain
VAAVGTRGARESLDERMSTLIGQARAAAPDTPLIAGFGVSRPEHIVSLLDAGADGAIVASAALDAVERGGPEALESFVRDLAGALRPRVA